MGGCSDCVWVIDWQAWAIFGGALINAAAILWAAKAAVKNIIKERTENRKFEVAEKTIRSALRIRNSIRRARFLQHDTSGQSSRGKKTKLEFLIDNLEITRKTIISSIDEVESDLTIYFGNEPVSILWKFYYKIHSLSTSASNRIAKDSTASGSANPVKSNGITNAKEGDKFFREIDLLLEELRASLKIETI